MGDVVNSSWHFRLTPNLGWLKLWEHNLGWLKLWEHIVFPIPPGRETDPMPTR